MRCAPCGLRSVNLRSTGRGKMFGKLNHLAITSDRYTLLGMFYRAVFGLRASGDAAREMSAVSVGDGYLGMTLIPRRGGRKAGLDHFGIEVEDLDKVRAKVAGRIPTSRSSNDRATGRLPATARTTPPATTSICRSRGTKTAPRSMPGANGSRTRPSVISRCGRARRSASPISTPTCSSSKPVMRRPPTAAIT